MLTLLGLLLGHQDHNESPQPEPSSCESCQKYIIYFDWNCKLHFEFCQLAKSEISTICNSFVNCWAICNCWAIASNIKSFAKCDSQRHLIKQGRVRRVREREGGGEYAQLLDADAELILQHFSAHEHRVAEVMTPAQLKCYVSLIAPQLQLDEPHALPTTLFDLVIAHYGVTRPHNIDFLPSCHILSLPTVITKLAIFNYIYLHKLQS